MEITEDVSLEVGGQRLRGFQEVNVARSIRDAKITFGLKATNPAWGRSAFALRVARDITIRAGADLMLVGDIDDYEGESGPGARREVRVSGRSRAARAVDSPPVKHRTGRIENKTLLDAAKELDEFGVGFTADVPLKPIPLMQRHPADSVFDTLERYARPQGLMLAGQPDGSIRITRGGEKRHAGALVEGRAPVKIIKVKVSEKNKASQQVVRGQRRIGTDADSLRQEETVFDPAAGRYRPAIIFGETDQDRGEAKRRGEWQRLREGAFGGVSATATTYGWRDEAGELWEPGRLIWVSVPSDRVEQDMRVESVTFTQNLDGGTIAVLTLADPRASGGKRGKSKSDPAYDVPEGNLE